MPTTTGGLRYPSLGSATNVPLDLQNLATDVDQLVKVAVASQAARLALPSPQTGLLVLENDSGYIYRKTSTGWQFVIGPQQASISPLAGITPASGWAVGDTTFRNLGNQMALMIVNFSRTGGTIDETPDGNLPNTDICTLPVKWRPPITIGWHSFATGRVAVGHLTNTGILRVAAVSPGGDIFNGAGFDAYAVYPLNDPTAS